ncbi:MAG: (d)CMP kinase [Thermovirgaceae bacterium]|nr:(d)CMP kinase [Thermovirgaceae bacterium]
MTLSGKQREMNQDKLVSRKIITIDGPAGAGKSTIARLVAKKIGYEYLDTGAVYRTISYHLSRILIPPVESEDLASALENCIITLRDGRVLLEGEDVSGSIRSQEVDRIVSAYSALPTVRRFLMRIQREQAGNADIVADGRDMGSVVFPEASVKIYLDASLAVRAKRRWKELADRGIEATYEEIMREIEERDRMDSAREISPLRVPEGARIIETSDMNVESVAEEILGIIESRAG